MCCPPPSITHIPRIFQSRRYPKLPSPSSYHDTLTAKENDTVIPPYCHSLGKWCCVFSYCHSSCFTTAILPFSHSSIPWYCHWSVPQATWTALHTGPCWGHPEQTEPETNKQQQTNKQKIVSLTNLNITKVYMFHWHVHVQSCTLPCCSLPLWKIWEIETEGHWRCWLKN